MGPAVAMALAVALSGPPSAPPAGGAAGDAPRPLLGPPAGSAFALEGRAGAASCGYCGLMLGGAIEKRSGWFLGGGFIEVAAPLGNTIPTSTKAAKTVGSYFAGGLAGVVGELRGGDRIGVAVEGGGQLASARADYSATSMRPSRTKSELIPVLGARASIEVRLSSGSLMGFAAFLREPLLHPCLDAGFGCSPPSLTYGLVLIGEFDLR